MMNAWNSTIETQLHLIQDDILALQRQGVTALLVQSPPGGGKTRLVEHIALQEVMSLPGRVMITTQTNEQAYDMARRLAAAAVSPLVHLLTHHHRSLPPDLSLFPNLVFLFDATHIPQDACIIIGNAVRWSRIDMSRHARFSCQIIDEAYQLAEYRFQQIAFLADQLILVGDPGQIAPVVIGSVARWQNERTGPHVSCPQALVTRYPQLTIRSLCASRRLVQDTVLFLQPAFYPTLPFGSLCPPGARQVLSSVSGRSGGIEHAIDVVQQGASLVQCELPPLITGEHDDALIQAVLTLIARLLTRDMTLRDEYGNVYPLTPSMLGVVCSHVSQVSALVRNVPPQYREIFIETADRFQGLERQIMIVAHPLSGRDDVDTFHLEQGRLCVMLSRHRYACFLCLRGGLEEMLRTHFPEGNRLLDIEDDREYLAWKSHIQLLSDLRHHGRVVQIP